MSGAKACGRTSARPMQSLQALSSALICEQAPAFCVKPLLLGLRQIFLRGDRP